jgi:thymidylate kinase
MWLDQQAEALQAVFYALNESRIEWMVLRNYEGLPNTNRSKDIDLVFKKSDFDQARRIISEAMKKHLFDIYDHTLYQYVWCFTFFNVDEERPLSLKIDLLDGFVWRGAQVVAFDDLYARKVSYADFFVPDQIYDGFMLWIKPLMTGGFIKEKYRQDILNTLAVHSSEFRSPLESTFGKSLSTEIWPILEQKNLDKTIRYKRRMCHAVWKKRFYTKPLNTITSTIDHFFNEIFRRIKRPPASMIAVVGPDGSGKSTFIELLHKSLSQALVKEPEDVRILHFRPNIFPNIKKLISGKNYNEACEEFTSPHRANPAGFVSSLSRITYYWLDYLFGYWLRIRRHCVTGKIYIFDRYCYDFVVDPYRSRVKLPDWLRSFYLKFTPEPDIVFFLCCDATTIYARKQELTMAEIDRQVRVYRKLSDRSNRFVTLDANKKPSELCSDALRFLIMKSFNKI